MSANIATTDLAWKIRRLRRDRGWTQVELAAECEVQRITVTRWETGATAPGVAPLCCLADALEVSVDWLLGRTP